MARPRSLMVRLVLLALAGVLAAGVAAAAAARWGASPLWIGGAAVAAGSLFSLATLGRAALSARQVLDALADGVRGFHDADYSLRLASGRGDELGELIDLYNRIGDALRDERRDIYQRELLLDTLLQGTPLATLLAAPGGRVIFSNRAARDLLGGGRRLEGQLLADVAAGLPEELRAAMEQADDALVTLPGQAGDETYRMARRAFTLNGRAHTLYLVERLTPELRRREVEAWKQAIRVINHELNNSLAPIRSLVGSARHVLDHPQHAHRLGEIFDTVEERVTHLATFLEAYAAIARLPRPRKEPVEWSRLLDRVRPIYEFGVDGELPARPGRMDAALVEQALINLVKNAHESGSPAGEVAISVQPAADGGFVIRVMDRGRGMGEEELGRALLPFYTSKAGGTGLGLPLSSEIFAAHGGRLAVENRAGGGLVVTCRLPPE